MPFTVIWIELVGIVLSEINQRQILCAITYVEFNK